MEDRGLEFFKKLLGGSNDKEIKKLRKTVDAIDALEPKYQKMTDEELRAETARIAAEAGVELNGSQVGQLVTLCRALEKLDPDALREKVQSVQETLQSLGAALEKAGGFFQRVMEAVNSVIDFFRGLFN